MSDEELADIREFRTPLTFSASDRLFATLDAEVARRWEAEQALESYAEAALKLRSEAQRLIEERDELHDLNYELKMAHRRALTETETERALRAEAEVQRLRAALDGWFGIDGWRIADGSEVGIPDGSLIACGIAAAALDREGEPSPEQVRVRDHYRNKTSVTNNWLAAPPDTSQEDEK